MIRSIGIENLGVITRAEVEVGSGLTVVTGETGAGKTMFVTALDLLTGGRADTTAVRAGSAKAVVEGVFDVTDTAAVRRRVEEAGGEAEAELIVTRQIGSGRGRATAGGRTVPVSVLTDIGDDLVSMHGQTEQLRLKSTARQRELLDAYGGPCLRAAKDAYTAAFDAWRSLRAEDERLRATAAERASRMSFLEEALEAIDRVRPEPDEDTRLKALSQRLAGAEALGQAVGSAHAALIGDDYDEARAASDLLNAAAAELARAAGNDDALATAAQTAQDLALRTADLAGDLAGYLAGFDELEETSLEETEERRAALASLSGYGGDVAAVLEFEAQAGSELLALREGDERSADMSERLQAARESLDEAAAALSAQRTKAADQFAQRVGRELRALSLPKAAIAFDVTPAEPAAHGADAVSLLFTAHSAQEPGDIGRLASGGELSRVMLAIEVVMAERTAFPTFVFDEVDAGVGGSAAIEIGRRLAKLAAHSQVIVVTHLAQVAAWADNHITVSKEDADAGAISGIARLTGADRERELARMLGGMQDSSAAQAHVLELMEQAAGEKSAWQNVKE